MECHHLAPLEAALQHEKIKETFRGQAWSQNCREWVYFDVVLDLLSLRERFSLDECIAEHSHAGTHDGQESGFVCKECKDAIMGVHPKARKGQPIFR